MVIIIIANMFLDMYLEYKGGTIMDRKRYIKILVAMAIAIIILVCDIVFSIKQEVDYEQRKESR